MIRFIISILLLFPATSFAQLADRLTIEMQPAFPQSNTPLSFTVRSYSMDLSRATITWYVNGTRLTEGEGETKALATTGALGTKTTITVEATGENGESLTETRVIRPAEVDLLWEADSYVPPFYRGKRLASSGSPVRVEAIPRLVRENGALMPTSDIIFTWRKNDAIVASASGRGKSSATFQGPELFGADTITVEAATRDDTMIAAASVLVRSTEPFVTLYQNHPLFGTLYHRSIPAEFNFSDSESTFVASPFFASARSADDPRLRYAWRVNRTLIAADPESPSRITLGAEGSDGVARVELSLTHATDYLMEATGLWRIVLNDGLGAVGNDIFGPAQ